MQKHLAVKGLGALSLCSAGLPGFAFGQASPAEVERAPVNCDHGHAHPNAPEELAQFDFLIGDFEITSHAMTPNGWSPPRPGPRARWNGWYSMGGMMITDEWYDPDPGANPDAPRGVNVRMFDEASKEWKMMWVATGAARVQDLRAKADGEKVRMWQVYPTQIDLVADFFVEDEDHWHRISYIQDEAGEWQPQFKLRATRLTCDTGDD